ncbi:MAG: hypothetical protein WBD40_15870 [Tepidisphaeraceae bacterium]
MLWARWNRLLATDLDAIDRRTFYGFFNDLLTAIRRLDRSIDTGDTSK